MIVFKKLQQVEEMIIQLVDYWTIIVRFYNYFKDYYKIIAIDLSKQQALDADPKSIQKKDFYRISSSSRKCKYIL